VKRPVRRYSVGDERLTVGEIVARTGLTDWGVRQRIRHGVRGADLLNPAFEKRIEIDGQTLTRREIAKRAGVTADCITRRMKLGLSGAELLRPPPQVARHEVNGEMLTVQQMADRAGITVEGMRYRLREKPRKPPVPDARFSRAPRGAPGTLEYLWRREIAEVAEAVAATWRAARGGYPFPGRLRGALTQHASTLLRLFRRGARVYRFGKALCGLGVRLDDDRPLTAKAVLGTWSRIEVALLKRLAARKDEAA
jgi:hypothetical protein